MKRLLLLVLLIAGGYWFYKYYLPKYGMSGVLHAVNGVQTTIQNQDYKQLLANDKKSSSTSAITVSGGTLQSLQQQVSQLKVTEIASSSPQIQQILKQLQSLPNDKIKAICVQLCSRL